MITILVVNEKDSSIDYVPSRSNSRVAKAPQSFWLNDILAVHEKALAKEEYNWIDSCTMMQENGFKLHLIDGPSQNIKITSCDVNIFSFIYPINTEICNAIIKSKYRNIIGKVSYFLYWLLVWKKSLPTGIY